MEKKITIAAVAIVALALAFAGVGYAATSYTGTTSSSGDSATVNYVTVGLGEGQYVGSEHKLYYDTVNSAGTITYTLQAGFTITYNVTIDTTPDVASVNLAATLPSVTIAGATVAWTLAGNAWDGTAHAVALTSGTATVAVVMTVTPGAGVTTAPADVASFGVTFTATASS